MRGATHDQRQQFMFVVLLGFVAAWDGERLFLGRRRA